jgi:4-hydroxy-3-methylbut-2-enyl diphosphate reductase
MLTTAIRPRGFCAGVERAIDIVEEALDLFEAPIYVRKEIVHNRAVVDGFRQRGVVFVESLDEVPENSVVVFSAHGVSPAVYDKARQRGLRVIDATCPLVTKVHLEVRRYVKQGYEIILIGHEGHDEVLGTTGEAPDHIHLVSTPDDVQRLEFPEGTRLVHLTQTTLSVDETRDVIEALQRRFPQIIGPPKDDICYATQNRQVAVKDLVRRQVELVLVLGSPNSSNSKRLCEVAEESGARAYLIDGIADIDPTWLQDVQKIGVTAGASAPEHLVQEVIAWLRQRGSAVTEETVIDENVTFGLPSELVAARRERQQATGKPV